MEYSYDDMVSKIVNWRDALEKGHNVNTVFDSICVYLGEQQREIQKLRNDTDKKQNVNPASYVIQVKKINNLRGIDSNITNAQANWIDLKGLYNTMDDAVIECKRLIETSSYKATDIRIMSPVCTFETSINTKIHNN